MKFVGRKETVFFPELEVGPIEAKIDTGAYGNAIHVDEAFVRDGSLRFSIGGKEHCFDRYKTVMVRSSNGYVQERYSVYLRMRLGGRCYKIKASLASRSEMRFPVLIGRRFLARFGFLVDVRKMDINDRAKAL